jgi:hypothetical protein
MTPDHFPPIDRHHHTALRIGGFLKLQPDRVYLHAGTKDGAKLFGLGDRTSITAADLWVPFRRLRLVSFCSKTPQTLVGRGREGQETLVI